MRSPARHERGVIAVEYALLLPFVLIIFSGLITFVHMFALRHKLSNIASVAARMGANQKVVNEFAGGEAANQRARTFLDEQLEKQGINGPCTIESKGAWVIGNPQPDLFLVMVMCRYNGPASRVLSGLLGVPGPRIAVTATEAVEIHSVPDES